MRTRTRALRILASAALAAAGVLSAPSVADAAAVVPGGTPRTLSSCQQLSTWSDGEGSRWTFTLCEGTVYVERTGALGDCSAPYPTGAPAETTDDGEYTGPI